MRSLRKTTITACLSLLCASATAFAVEFIPVGPGSCLDIHGLRPQRHYKMGGVSASDCRQVCEASPHCTAYSHRTTDGYCSVFGTGMAKERVPAGWLHWPGNGLDDVVRSTGGANTRICFRKDTSAGITATSTTVSATTTTTAATTTTATTATATTATTATATTATTTTIVTVTTASTTTTTTSRTTATATATTRTTATATTTTHTSTDTATTTTTRASNDNGAVTGVTTATTTTATMSFAGLQTKLLGILDGIDDRHNAADAEDDGLNAVNAETDVDADADAAADAVALQLLTGTLVAILSRDDADRADQLIDAVVAKLGGNASSVGGAASDLYNDDGGGEPGAATNSDKVALFRFAVIAAKENVAETVAAAAAAGAASIGAAASTAMPPTARATKVINVAMVVGVVCGVVALLGLIAFVAFRHRPSTHAMHRTQTSGNGAAGYRRRARTAIPTTEFIRRNTASAVAPGDGTSGTILSFSSSSPGRGEVLYAVPSMSTTGSPTLSATIYSSSNVEGCSGGDNADENTLHLDSSGYIVPRASLRMAAYCGGGSELDAGGYVADPSFCFPEMTSPSAHEYATIEGPPPTCNHPAAEAGSLYNGANSGGAADGTEVAAALEYQVPFELAAEYESAAGSAAPTVRVYGDATPACRGFADYGRTMRKEYRSTVVDSDNGNDDGTSRRVGPEYAIPVRDVSLRAPCSSELDAGGYVADPSFYVTSTSTSIRTSTSNSSGASSSELNSTPHVASRHITARARVGRPSSVGAAGSAIRGVPTPNGKRAVRRLQSRTSADSSSSSSSSSVSRGGRPAVVINPMYNGKKHVVVSVDGGSDDGSSI